MAATATLLASGPSSTATTTISGWSCAADDRLVLVVSSSDYKTGDPAGYAVRTERTGGSVWQGSYVWDKVATGTETSIAYTIGSASKSAYVLFKISGLDTAATPVVATVSGSDGSAGNATITVNNLTTGASGTWFAVAAIDATSGVSLPTYGAWANGYTELGAGQNTAGADYNMASVATKSGVAASTATGTSRTTSGNTFSRVGLGVAYLEAADPVEVGPVSATPLVWDGSAWVPLLGEVWDGAPVGRPAQVWDGAAWTP